MQAQAPGDDWLLERSACSAPGMRFAAGPPAEALQRSGNSAPALQVKVSSETRNLLLIRISFMLEKALSYALFVLGSRGNALYPFLSTKQERSGGSPARMMGQAVTHRGPARDTRGFG